MKKSRKFPKYALTAILVIFIDLSMYTQQFPKNPLDNADKRLVYTQVQQDNLTQKLTTFWTNKLTPEVTAEWNEQLTENLSVEIEEKLMPNLTAIWGLILNEKYPNNEKIYRE